jgi:hypothetical protein
MVRWVSSAIAGKSFSATSSPAGPIVPGTPAAAYAITGTSKCIASRSGTQKPSCSERQRYADARR